MAHLIVSNRQLDPLWRRFPPFSAPGAVCLDWDDNSTTRSTPHRRDLLGWRRWLRRSDIDTLSCLQPDGSFYVLLAAAALNKIKIILYLTGLLSPSLLRIIRHFHPRVESFGCPSEALSRRLRDLGVPPEKLFSNLPNLTDITPVTPAESCLRELRQIGRAGPVLLAQPLPHDHRALEIVVWSAALLEHVFKDLVLVVTGPCDRRDQARMRRWQRCWDCPNMIHFDRRRDWTQWLSTADVVLAAGEKNSDPLRLLHARAAGACIVTPRASAPAFLRHYPHATLVHPPQPRHLAAAALPLLQYSPTSKY